ncbi:cysteine hydrolase family protein [Thaumasiovibrio subtropicus]|uniref:cysteine hydrolase family protein n=1 Tax=Thaumasiovibrio subtropicus TaxID=1891207 RepID=UPI00192CFAAC|nr:isochorismatase family protein [Thaumasiovibrio subtropicus]
MKQSNPTTKRLCIALTATWLAFTTMNTHADNGEFVPAYHHYVNVEAYTDFRPHNTAVMLIDAQKAYVPGTPDFWPSIYYPEYPIPPQNTDYDLGGKIARIAQIANKANERHFPTLITLEGDIDNHSPFIDSVANALPAETEHFFKSYFNATSEADIYAHLRSLQHQGIYQIIVAGAETDVCVLQTVLGLKAMGFDVYVASDAVFSTEVYAKPTFKRLQQAQVKLAETTQLLAALDGESKVVLSPRYAIKPRYNLYQGDRREMAALFFNQDAESIQFAEHDNRDAVQYRTRQWTNFVSYALTPASDVPAIHINAQHKRFAPHLKAAEQLQTVNYIDNAILSMITRGKSQAVISGVVSQPELLNAVIKLRNAGITPVILEDDLMGKKVDPITYLDTAYNLGAIPSTQKVTGYEITAAIQYRDLTQTEMEALMDMYNLSNNQTLTELMPRLR